MRYVVPLAAVAVWLFADLATADAPTVAIQLFQFAPSPVAVEAGARVTWTNRDDIEHTVTAGEPDRRTGRFDLRLPGPGASESVTFTERGVYPYFCDRHRSMRGEIRVN
ncbi:MAG: cupredoxin domain-containing protein [Candidatus Rokubacteria bacterium]|nr:cupredoxin domain-containing protein [Candidatus Rokubacteria bacterium]